MRYTNPLTHSVPGTLICRIVVQFKTAVLMYKATHGTAPSYLSQLVRVADLPGRRSLCSARTNCLLVPSVKLSIVGGRAFLSPDPPSGTACRTMWTLPRFCQPSVSVYSILHHISVYGTFCSRPRSLTLSLIPGKLFPTSSGSWSDFITWTTLKIHDWWWWLSLSHIPCFGTEWSHCLSGRGTRASGGVWVELLLAVSHALFAGGVGGWMGGRRLRLASPGLLGLPDPGPAGWPHVRASW